MVCGYSKNLLAIGLLAMSTSVFAQSVSFVIECKVSGRFLDATSEIKISNQTVLVTIDSKPPAASVTVEGSGHLNIGIVLVTDAKVNNQAIHVFQIRKNNLREISKSISINRVTGFIEIAVIDSIEKPFFLNTTIVSGFCSKASTKPKF